MEEKSVFNNELFDEADISKVAEKMEENMAVLFSNEEYMEIDDKIQELNINLTTILNSPELEMFQRYIKINTDIINYQNCLAYYLGMQYGMKINELK